MLYKFCDGRVFKPLFYIYFVAVFKPFSYIYFVAVFKP
jgi:hypothetical protein